MEGIFSEDLPPPLLVRKFQLSFVHFLRCAIPREFPIPTVGGGGGGGGEYGDFLEPHIYSWPSEQSTGEPDNQTSLEPEKGSALFNVRFLSCTLY